MPKGSDDDASDQQHFFDEYFREELRNHGRWYFEKVIGENGELFKKDLESTISQVNLELKEHVTKQLDSAIAQINIDLKEHVTKQIDDKFVEYTRTMKEAQDAALDTITKSAESLRAQHQTLAESLQKNAAEQETMLHTVFDENRARITSMSDAQNSALQWLNHSAQTLQEQYQQISATLQKNVVAQETMLVDAFQNNMAQVVEHYLLGALGDQYDVKAQLPSIIKQMEENKQDIADDMKL